MLIVSKWSSFSSLFCCIYGSNVNILSMNEKNMHSQRDEWTYRKKGIDGDIDNNNDNNDDNKEEKKIQMRRYTIWIWIWASIFFVCTVNDGECEKQEVAYYNQWMPFFLFFFLSFDFIIYSFDATTYAYHNQTLVHTRNNIKCEELKEENDEDRTTKVKKKTSDASTSHVRDCFWRIAFPPLYRVTAWTFFFCSFNFWIVWN